MRSLAEIIIIMPAVASSTSTGYSNFIDLASEKSSNDSISATAEPPSTSSFMKRANPSTTNAPSNSVVAGSGWRATR